MLSTHLTEAEKTQKRIRRTRTCPFEVVKGGLSPQMQQQQLSRILQVHLPFFEN